jgi:hypothetical protein
MNWSMPPSVLRLVAFGLGFACLGAFTLALATAPSPGRLPGERSSGAAGLVLQAQDATPLLDERIEGAPVPDELTEEEKAALEAEKKAKEEALALAKAEAAKGAPAGPESVVAAPVAAAPAEKAAPPPPPPPPKVEEPVF